MLTGITLQHGELQWSPHARCHIRVDPLQYHYHKDAHAVIALNLETIASDIQQQCCYTADRLPKRRATTLVELGLVAYSTHRDAINNSNYAACFRFSVMHHAEAYQ